MPDQFHPRLRDDGTLAPREDAPATEEPKQEVPVTPPAETPAAAPSTPPEATTEQPTPPAEPEVQKTEEPSAPTAETIVETPPNPNLLTIDLSQGGRDLVRLANENPDFKRRVLEYAGRTVKREYEAKVTQLEAELKVANKQLVKTQIRNMSPEEIDERFRTDKDFAQLYAEFVHDQDGEEDVEDLSFQSEMSYYEVTRDDRLDQALAAGMTEGRRDQFLQAFNVCPLHKTDEHGFFDHDANGTMYEDRYRDPAMARKAAFDRFQEVLTAEIALMTEARTRSMPPPRQAAAATPPAAQAAPEPPKAVAPPNPALSRSPDTSFANRGAGAPNRKYTADELSQMSPPERIALVNSLGGRQKMIEDGILYVPGLSEKLTG